MSTAYRITSGRANSLKAHTPKSSVIIRVGGKRYQITDKKLSASSRHDTKYAVSTSIYVELIEDVCLLSESKTCLPETRRYEINATFRHAKNTLGLNKNRHVQKTCTFLLTFFFFFFFFFTRYLLSTTEGSEKFLAAIPFI